MALVLWSFGATNATFLSNIPTFQVLTLVFLACGLVPMLKLVKTSAWGALKVSWKTYGLIISGVGLQQVFYITAFANAQPAEADIIIYLWPVISVVLCAVFLKDKIKPRYWVAAAPGSASVVLISFSKLGSGSGLNLGHFAALGSAISWASYSAFAQRTKGISEYTIGLVYLFLAGTCASYAFMMNQNFVPMTGLEVGVLLFHATTILFGFHFWTIGIQKGKAKQLTVSSYMKPILSLLLLNQFGFTEITTTIMIACTLVAFSGLIAQGGIFQVASIVMCKDRGLALEMSHKNRKNIFGYALFCVVSYACTLRENLMDSAVLSMVSV